MTARLLDLPGHLAGCAPAFGPAEREQFLERFYELDAQLAAKGFPALSPFWRTEVARFIRSGCRLWTIRAGRRSGKSTTLCKLTIAWGLFGPWHTPPGDTATIPFLSTNKDEAGNRLKTIGAMLDALDVSYERRGEELEMVVP